MEKSAIRLEFILVGCILVVVGIGLCVVGYNELAPSGLEQAVETLQGLSGQEANLQLRHPNALGYPALVMGGLLFIAGIVFLLKSRRQRIG